MSIYDPSLDSWAMGPALPRAISECSATTTNGEISVTGRSKDDGRTYFFVYRNSEWLDLAAPGAPTVHAGAFASILLG